jgi:hypothetical protein
MPPTSPARIDSIGKPGTGDGGIDVVVLVEVVALELLVVVLRLPVDVVVWITVVIDVVVPGTLSGP